MGKAQRFIKGAGRVIGCANLQGQAAASPVSSVPRSAPESAPGRRPAAGTSGCDSEVHHIRLVHHRLGADVACHRARRPAPQASRKGDFPARKRRFFRSTGRKSKLFPAPRPEGHARAVMCAISIYFASYQLFPNFASAVSGTLRDATFSISRLTSAATSWAMPSGHSTISSS